MSLDSPWIWYFRAIQPGRAGPSGFRLFEFPGGSRNRLKTEQSFSSLEANSLTIIRGKIAARSGSRKQDTQETEDATFLDLEDIMQSIHAERDKKTDLPTKDPFQRIVIPAK